MPRPRDTAASAATLGSAAVAERSERGGCWPTCQVDAVLGAMGTGLVAAAPSGAPLETLPSEERGPRPLRPAPRSLPAAAERMTVTTVRDDED